MDYKVLKVFALLVIFRIHGAHTIKSKPIKSSKPQIVELISSCHDCFINIINFQDVDRSSRFLQEIHLKPGARPFLLNNGLEFLTRLVFYRAKGFHVVNLLVFPEQRDRSRLGDTRWIPLVLYRTAPRYGHCKNCSSESSVFTNQQLLEKHHLLIVTRKKSRMWYFDLKSYRADFVQSIFIFHLTPKTGIVSHSYICQYCLTQGFMDVQIPVLPANFRNTLHYLNEIEMKVYGYGSRSCIDLKSHGSFKLLHVENRGRSDTLANITISPFKQNSRLILENIAMIFLRESLNLKSLHEIQDELMTNWGWNATAFRFKVPDNYIDKRPSIEFKELRSELTANYKSQFIVATDISFDFITCDGVTTDSYTNTFYSDILIFFSPFGCWVWIVTLFLLLFIPALIGAIANWTQSLSVSLRCLPPSKLRSFSFNFHLSLSSLLENGSDLNLTKYMDPIIPKQFSSVAYCLFSTWLIYLFFHNNLYKGVLTSVEIVLPPPTSKWSKIVQLVNFTFVTPTMLDYWKDTDKPALLLQRTQLGNSLGIAVKRIKSEGILSEFNYPYLLTLFNQTYGHQGWNINNKTAFYNFIANCNKTAFIDTGDRIESFIKYFETEAHLRKDSIIFMSGNDDFLKTSFGWVFSFYSKVYFGHLYRKLQEFFHSGIYGLYKKYYDRNNSTMVVGGRVKSRTFALSSEARPVGLRGKISSLLALCLMLCFVAVVIFMLELLIIIKKRNRLTTIPTYFSITY